ncbi:MAG: hemolysin III family protein [Planctomycetota bacterium]|nr:hemolysin III family protein [Planctomycetota bacterium]
MSPHREMVSLFGLAEPLSCLTHVAIGLTLAALSPALVRRGRGAAERAALAAYALAVVAMFLVSGSYHALPASHPARDVLWHLDHASIWLGLAATFSAVRIVFVPGPALPTVAGLWGIAVAGVAAEMVAMRDMALWISPALYILMGWCGLPTVLSAGRAHGAHVSGPLLAAGVVVTFGGFMDVFQAPRLLVGVVEAHELLHLTTLVGGVVYFRGLWLGAALPALKAAPTPGPVEAAPSAA